MSRIVALSFLGERKTSQPSFFFDRASAPSVPGLARRRRAVAIVAGRVEVHASCNRRKEPVGVAPDRAAIRPLLLPAARAQQAEVVPDTVPLPAKRRPPRWPSSASTCRRFPANRAPRSRSSSGRVRCRALAGTRRPCSKRCPRTRSRCSARCRRSSGSSRSSEPARSRGARSRAVGLVATGRTAAAVVRVGVGVHLAAVALRLPSQLPKPALHAIAQALRLQEARAVARRCTPCRTRRSCSRWSACWSRSRCRVAVAVGEAGRAGATLTGCRSSTTTSRSPGCTRRRSRRSSWSC